MLHSFLGNAISHLKNAENKKIKKIINPINLTPSSSSVHTKSIAIIAPVLPHPALANREIK